MEANRNTVVTSSAEREPAAGSAVAARWARHRGRRAPPGRAMTRMCSRPAWRDLHAGIGRPAGIARARAGERDQSRDDGAEERQENDRLIHTASALHQVDVFDRDRAAIAVVRRREWRARWPLPPRRRSAPRARRPARRDRRGRLEKATRLMLTASRISSIDIRMMMTFLRLRKMPNMPIVNRMAATVR